MRTRWIAVVAVVATASAAIGWAARDTVLANGDAVAAARSFAAWTGDAGKIVAGAPIGALGAWVVGRANRNELRRTRFHDDLRSVTTDLLRAAEWHRRAREDQFAAWSSAADNGTGGPFPDVPATQSIFDAAVALDVVAARETAKAGWSVYGQSVYLDKPEFTYDAKRHGDVAGAIIGPSGTDRDMLKAYLKSYHRRVWEFTNAVRVELGIEPLPEPDP